MPQDLAINNDGSGNLYSTTPASYNGVLDSRNPTLVPHTDVIDNDPNGYSLFPHESVPQYISNHPRVSATGTLLVGGTIHTGDVLTATINGTACAYTVLSTDTTTTAAAGLAAVIAEKVALDGIVYAVIDGTTAQQVDLTAADPGPFGNTITLTAAVSGGGHTTTLTASGATLGVGAGTTAGSGPIIPTVDFPFYYNGTTMYFYTGKPVIVTDPVLLAQLVTLQVFN